MKKGLIEKLTRYSRITQETNAVEKLLENIDKGKAIYGMEKTKDSLENDLVSLLLVSDIKVREFEGLLDIADRNRCNIIVISSEHDAGEKLLGLGGVGAILF